MSKSKRQSPRRQTSKSTNSVSDSTAQIKKAKPRLSRLLGKRDIRLEPTMEEDFKWFWAAYKKGTWKDIIEDDLTQDQFVEYMLHQFVDASDLYTIYFEKKVIGLVVVTGRMFLSTRYVRPFINWFPWASDRNKIEGAVRVILELRKSLPVLVDIPPELSKFVTHIAKYGILRRVGKLDQGGEEVFLLESVRSN